MFTLITLTDSLRVPAHMLSLPTLVSVHKEIDLKFPNRVLMDVGLVICRYGDCLKISNGSCVPGDGGSHHDCLFRLVVFRPFVEEVCVGRIVKSNEEGIQVSLGFFQDIFIPAYWMLRPSHYDEKIGLWVWTPKYDEDDDEEDDDGDGNAEANTDIVKEEAGVKQEAGEDKKVKGETTEGEQETQEKEKDEEEEGDRFEMDIGAEIRFKVKSIHFTQVTNTAKGVQATTTTTAHSHTFPKQDGQEDRKNSGSSAVDKPLRKRSLSVDLSDASDAPASMHIVASICEDGLGLTSWWTAGDDEDDEEDAAADPNDAADESQKDDGQEGEDEGENLELVDEVGDIGVDPNDFVDDGAYIHEDIMELEDAIEGDDS